MHNVKAQMKMERQSEIIRQHNIQHKKESKAWLENKVIPEYLLTSDELEDLQVLLAALSESERDPNSEPVIPLKNIGGFYTFQSLNYWAMDEEEKPVSHLQELKDHLNSLA